MPSRFESGVYPPDVASLMREALNGAWERVQAASKDAELTRLLLASAIIDLVEAGVSNCDQMVAQAVRMFEAADNISRTSSQNLRGVRRRIVCDNHGGRGEGGTPSA
jgi:hypothetical protein